MLHVTPPMGSPEVLRNHKTLVNEAGFLDVSADTLQSTRYKNVFGLGDCTSTPNSKTMAAIGMDGWEVEPHLFYNCKVFNISSSTPSILISGAQSKVLYQNIMDNLSGKKMKMTYDGYASCPLVTSHDKCILAEFDYKLRPKETFPVNQGQERYSMYLLKEYFFPFLYWNFMLKWVEYLQTNYNVNASW